MGSVPWLADRSNNHGFVGAPARNHGFVGAPASKRLLYKLLEEAVSDQRGILRLAMTAMTAMAVIVTVAMPAQAYGGGCKDSAANGWRIGVCSSDNGENMYTDYYINWYDGPMSSQCYSRSRIEDVYENVYTPWRNNQCGIGRQFGNSLFLKDKGITGLRNHVEIRQDFGQGYITTFSNYSYYTYCC